MNEERERAAVPMAAAYLVPLRYNGQQARSYVFAFTRWLPPDEVFRYLPTLSGFAPPEMPYRASEVRQLALNSTGLEELPQELLAREQLLGRESSTFRVDDLVIAFREARSGARSATRYSDAAAVLREGSAGAGGGDESAETGGDDALWRDGRVTVLVDLDAMLRNDAAQLMHSCVSPFVTAAGSLGMERHILSGHAHKWDSNRGRFFSADETTEAYQVERIAALDALGTTVFRRAVHPARLTLLRPEMRRRAKSRGLSRIDEWTDSRRVNLGLVISSIVADELAAMTRVISESPPRALRDWEGDSTRFVKLLRRKVRAALNAAMTEDYTEDPKWRRWEEEQELIDEIVGADDPELTQPPVSDDDLLRNALGETLLRRAKLTAAEKHVLIAIARLGDDETLADWARQNGISPSTANVHKRNAKRKIENAKKLT